MSALAVALLLHQQDLEASRRFDDIARGVIEGLDATLEAQQGALHRLPSASTDPAVEWPPTWRQFWPHAAALGWAPREGTDHLPIRHLLTHDAEGIHPGQNLMSDQRLSRAALRAMNSGQSTISEVMPHTSTQRAGWWLMAPKASPPTGLHILVLPGQPVLNQVRERWGLGAVASITVRNDLGAGFEEPAIRSSPPDGLTPTSSPGRQHRSIRHLWQGTPMVIELRSSHAHDAAHASGLPWLVGGLMGLCTALSALVWGRRPPPSRSPAQASAPGSAQALAVLARQTSTLVVITDAHQRITWVNAAFEQLSGHAAQEAMGRTPGALLQCTPAHAGGRPGLPLSVQESREEDLLSRAKDGRAFWLRLNTQPIRDDAGAITGFMSIGTDITLLKEADKVARTRQGLLDQTGMVAGVGGWSLDVATRTLSWTDQFCRILEFDTTHQLNLQDCLSCLSPGDRQAVERALQQQFRDRAEWDVELTVTTHRGRPCRVRLMAEGAYDDLGLVRIVGSLQALPASG